MKAWLQPIAKDVMIDALDQELRGRHHQRDVLAGARLGLVGVDTR
jgi:hypothetical protein